MADTLAAVIVLRLIIISSAAQIPCINEGCTSLKIAARDENLQEKPDLGSVSNTKPSLSNYIVNEIDYKTMPDGKLKRTQIIRKDQLDTNTFISPYIRSITGLREVRYNNSGITTGRHYSTPSRPYSTTREPYSTTRRYYSTTKGPYSTFARRHSSTRGFFFTTMAPSRTPIRPYYVPTKPYYEIYESRVLGGLNARLYPPDERGVDSEGEEHNLNSPAVQVQDFTAVTGPGELDLTGFNLTGVGVKAVLDRLADLSPLSLLLLSTNNISSLPRQVFPVHLEYSLRELRLDNNPLVFLYDDSCFELSRLRVLRVLSMARTRLQYITSIYLPALESLDLSDNHLTMVPPSLHTLTSLQRLNLSGNYLVWLDSYPLNVLTNLRALDLSGNGIKYVRDNPIGPLRLLETLRLDNNALEFPVVLDAVLPTVRIHLGDNPWQCSCALVTLALHDLPYVQDLDNIKCSYKEDHNGGGLWSLREEGSRMCHNRLESVVSATRNRIRRYVEDIVLWSKHYLITTDQFFVLLEVLFVVYAALQVYTVVLVVHNSRLLKKESVHSSYTSLTSEQHI